MSGPMDRHVQAVAERARAHHASGSTSIDPIAYFDADNELPCCGVLPHAAHREWCSGSTRKSKRASVASPFDALAGLERRASSELDKIHDMVTAGDDEPSTRNKPTRTMRTTPDRLRVPSPEW